MSKDAEQKKFSRNVLMISPHPFLIDRGSPILIYNKLKASSDLGCNITLLSHPEGRDVRLPGVVIKRALRVPFVRNRSFGPSFHKIVYDFLILLKGLQLKKKYDIMYAHDTEGTFIAVLLKKLGIQKIPIIYDMHNVFSEYMKNTGMKGYTVFEWLFTAVEKFLYRNSEVLVMVSPAIMERLKEFGQEKKAIFIPDTVFFEKESVDKRLQEELQKKFGGKKTLLYTGNLRKNQGIDLMLKAFRMIRDKDVVLLIVGGESWAINKFKKRYRMESVHFQGKQLISKIPTYLTFCDITLSPRLSGTNTPSKIYFYLKMGKPLVATNIPAHNCILTHGKDALLCRTNPKDMAEKISMLLENEKLKMAVSQGGLELYRKQFSYERFNEKVKNAYNMIV